MFAICEKQVRRAGRRLLRWPGRWSETGGVGVGEGQKGDVRGMLLQAQPAVCAAPGRGMRHLPAGLPRGAPPAAAAALRVPRAAYEVGLRLPHRRGAGGASRLRRGLTPREPLDPMRVGAAVGGSHSTPGVSVSPWAITEQKTASAARLKISSPASTARPRTSSEKAIV